MTALSYAMIKKLPSFIALLKENGAYTLLANFGMIPSPFQMEYLYYFRANVDSGYCCPGLGLDFEYCLCKQLIQKRLEASLSRAKYTLLGITGVDQVLLNQTL